MVFVVYMLSVTLVLYVLFATPAGTKPDEDRHPDGVIDENDNQFHVLHEVLTNKAGTLSLF